MVILIIRIIFRQLPSVFGMLCTYDNSSSSSNGNINIENNHQAITWSMILGCVDGDMVVGHPFPCLQRSSNTLDRPRNHPRTVSPQHISIPTSKDHRLGNSLILIINTANYYCYYLMCTTHQIRIGQYSSGGSKHCFCLYLFFTKIPPQILNYRAATLFPDCVKYACPCTL